MSSSLKLNSLRALRSGSRVLYRHSMTCVASKGGVVDIVPWRDLEWNSQFENPWKEGMLCLGKLSQFCNKARRLCLKRLERSLDVFYLSVSHTRPEIIKCEIPSVKIRQTMGSRIVGLAVCFCPEAGYGANAKGEKWKYRGSTMKKNRKSDVCVCDSGRIREAT